MNNIVDTIQYESIPDFAKKIIKVLNDNNYEAYLVGGCVRDLLLGKIPHDWDITTNALPDETISILKLNSIRFHTVGIDFGTVVALDNNIEYEITTYRSETTYNDGRHPDNVKFEKCIENDLKRRDFSINAMAYNPLTYEIVDKFNGANDLDNGIIRTVGNPDERFKEDSLRILRALRFAIKYGFNIEDDTFESMLRNVKSLDNISKERITSELEKILTSGSEIRKWFIKGHNIVFQIIPELRKTFMFKQNNKYHKHDVYEHILYVVDNCKSNKFEIKLAALLHDIGKPDAYVTDDKGHGHFYGHPEISYNISINILGKNKNSNICRLKLTNEQSDRVLNLVRYHDAVIASTEKSVKRALNKHGEDFIYDWVILKQADMDDHVYNPETEDHLIDTKYILKTTKEIIEKQSCFSLKDLKIDGKVLMNELKLKPGKEIGTILNTLLDEVINDDISNETSELIKRAKEISHNI